MTRSTTALDLTLIRDALTCRLPRTRIGTHRASLVSPCTVRCVLLHIATHPGESPSLVELAAAVDICDSAAWKAVKVLLRLGIVTSTTVGPGRLNRRLLTVDREALRRFSGGRKAA